MTAKSISEDPSVAIQSGDVFAMVRNNQNFAPDSDEIRTFCLPTKEEVLSKYSENLNANIFTDSHLSKLENIEANATQDQTGDEIKDLYEALSDVNRFSDSLKSKLENIEANATQDQTGLEIQSLYEALSDVNRFSDVLKSKLDGIESNATQDQTGAEIQNLYEALSDVNRFSDSDKNDITANALDIDDLQTSVSNLSSTLNQADQDNLEEAKSYAASMAIVFG